jgi:EAL and modified HD-GYP domain-containing signal transduction protein
VYLTYQLLKYINSLYFALPMRVTSVDHAVSLLGLLKIRQWLFVTSLAGMDESPMSQEIVYISAFRAKFLELLSTMAEQGRYRDLAQKLFLTGLFSLLESMMRVPLQEIFAAVALDPDILDALSGRPGPLTPWFELMLSYEKGCWDDVCSYSGALRISDPELAAAYIEAGRWSAALFGNDPS